MRSLSGQVEELQFENRQLRERLQRNAGRCRVPAWMNWARGCLRRSRSGAEYAACPKTLCPPRRRWMRRMPRSLQPRHRCTQAGPGRGDAFDPGRDPLAPGTPQPLGSTSALPAPLALPRRDPRQWRRRADGQRFRSHDEPCRKIAQFAIFNGDASAQDTGDTAPRPSIAATGDADPRTLYDSAYALLLQGALRRCRDGFSASSCNHTRGDDLAAAGALLLGESYRGQERYREAAEQFLTVSTEYSETDVRAAGHVETWWRPRRNRRIGAGLRNLRGDSASNNPQAAEAMRDNICA